MARLSLALMALAISAAVAIEPVSQVHIALGPNPSEMSVMWATPDPDSAAENTTVSSVQYGTEYGQLTLSAVGTSEVLRDLGDLRRNITTHTVWLTGLAPATRYFYRCGSADDGWSNIFSFKTLPLNPAHTADHPAITYAVLGDMGLVNGVSLPMLEDEVMRGDIDVVIHVGDLAYDMHDDNGLRGDMFLQAIQPVASTVPYMVCPGNHESAYTYLHYTKRFEGMPHHGKNPSPNNWYYSYDVGLVHWVSFSSEIYFYQTAAEVEAQYHWLKADLAAAAANRHATPWIIAMAHRPMYCSCDGDCDDAATTLRDGIVVTVDGKPTRKFGIEELFHEYGVDLYLCGHEHNYERLYPTYKWRVEDHAVNHYDNPTSVVQIITGSAGCQEGHEPFTRPIGNFSAFHSVNYGYSHLRVENATHLYWNQVDVGASGVEDYLWVTKKPQPTPNPHRLGWTLHALPAQGHSGSKAVLSAPRRSMFHAAGLAAPVDVQGATGCPPSVRRCTAAKGCECLKPGAADPATGVVNTCAWAPCKPEEPPVTDLLRSMITTLI